MIGADRNYELRRWKSRILLGLCVAALLMALVPLISILWEVFSRGLPLINWDFLTKRQLSQYYGGGGVGQAVVGSLWITGMACLMGLPVGILAGIYLAEYGHGRFAEIVRFFSEVFAEFPSIVIGLFCYVVVVGAMGHFSLLAGSIALAIIMIPVVTRTTEEALHLVPAHVREAAIALGAPKWKATMRVTLSTARAGLITGSMLAFARIFGETAPLLMTIGTSIFFAQTLDDQASTLTVVVFRGATAPTAEAQNIAWGAAALLLLIVLIINVSIRYITLRRQTQGGTT